MTLRPAYETARLKLARIRVDGQQARSLAAQRAVQISADALDVERVGLWLLQAGDRKLTCAHQYVRSSALHTAGPELLTAQFPAFVAALRERRVIAASDARSHVHTRELVDTYLEPMGIGAMLCAPIIRDGHFAGIVCHEHVGGTRSWQQKEIDFACSVADMVALILEQADRVELEAALQAQAELRLESQKMEALGRLARSVAHDFNGLLTVINGVGGELGAMGEGLARQAAELLHVGELGARLLEQLLTFGQEQAVPVAPTALDSVLLALRPVLVSLVGADTRFTLEILTERTKVMLSRAALEQIALNLCTNARDAVRGNGRIAVRLRDAEAHEELGVDCLVMEVEDNGQGMDEQTAQRVFEPYFTTKAHGHGLGLSLVYGVVQGAGGHIMFESAPGHGTRFVVSFPHAPD